jgi:hypothetical protein
MCSTCVCSALGRSEGVIRSLGTGVVDGCKLSCGCWEQNPGPLQEQQVPLSSEAPFQSPVYLCMVFMPVKVPVETISVSDFAGAYL